MEAAMQRRRRFKQTETLHDRLSRFSRDMRENANSLPPGPEKNDLLKRARTADAATHIEEWISSPDINPPSRPVKMQDA